LRSLAESLGDLEFLSLQIKQFVPPSVPCGFLSELAPLEVEFVSGDKESEYDNGERCPATGIRPGRRTARSVPGEADEAAQDTTDRERQ
jgi:hypothetical protein